MSKKKPKLTDNQIKMVREWATLSTVVESRSNSILPTRTDGDASILLMREKIDELETRLGMK